MKVVGALIEACHVLTDTILQNSNGVNRRAPMNEIRVETLVILTRMGKMYALNLIIVQEHPLSNLIDSTVIDAHTDRSTCLP